MATRSHHHDHVRACCVSFLQVLARAAHGQPEFLRLDVRGVADHDFVPRNGAELVLHAGVARLRDALAYRLFDLVRPGVLTELVSVVEQVLRTGLAYSFFDPNAQSHVTSVRRRVRDLSREVVASVADEARTVDFGSAYLDVYSSVGQLHSLYGMPDPVEPLVRTWSVRTEHRLAIQRLGGELQVSYFTGLRPDGFPLPLAEMAHQGLLSQSLTLAMTLPTGFEAQVESSIARRVAFAALMRPETPSDGALVLAACRRLVWAEGVVLAREQARLRRFCEGSPLVAPSRLEGCFLRGLCGVLRFLLSVPIANSARTSVGVIQALVEGWVSPSSYPLPHLLSYLERLVSRSDGSCASEAADRLRHGLTAEAYDPIRLGWVGGESANVHGASLGRHIRCARDIAASGGVSSDTAAGRQRSGRSPFVSREFVDDVRDKYQSTVREFVGREREQELQRLRRTVDRLLRVCS